jgi:hypothetical protein
VLLFGTVTSQSGKHLFNHFVEFLFYLIPVSCMHTVAILVISLFDNSSFLMHMAFVVKDREDSIQGIISLLFLHLF